MKSLVVRQQHLTPHFQICASGGPRSDDSHLRRVALIPHLLIEGDNFFARVTLALHGICVQFFERPVNRVSQVKFDASYRRRNFVDIAELILLRALLVGGQLAMRKTRHSFSLRIIARLFDGFPGGSSGLGGCSARLHASRGLNPKRPPESGLYNGGRNLGCRTNSTVWRQTRSMCQVSSAPRQNRSMP